MRFKKKMLQMRLKNSSIALCLSVKQNGKELIIVAIYVNDLNLLRTNKIMVETITVLKNMFEMRDLGRNLFGIGLQFEHLLTEILLHQSTYPHKLFKNFVCIRLKINEISNGPLVIGPKKGSF
jgi:hypothetical protein